MCAKHTACQSNKVASQPASNSCCSPKLAINKVTAISSIANGGETCCASEACSSSDTSEEAERPDLTLSSFAAERQSWLISGMDCPSCAQKLEKAILGIPGVNHAKVLFSTEKLVVDFDSLSLVSAIEQTAEKTGFPLAKVGSTQTKAAVTTQPQGALALIQANWSIVLIALGMIIAALLGTVSEPLSNGLFVLTCLAGLYPVAKKAWRLARSGTPFAIETLMSVAAIGALYLGESVEAAMVLLLFLIGEKLEAYAASRARSGVQALMALVPENSVKIVDGKRVKVAASALLPGDVVEISPGARLPADGVLLTDSASFDESTLTGESVPAEHTSGAKLMAGVVAVDKVVRIEVTSKQGENAIDRILHLIEEAESRKAPLERFLDRFSRWYTPLMMLVALAVVIVPPLVFAQPWETWVYRGLALLLIACPCALVISTPAAITSGLAAAAKRGALIKGGAALEQLGKVEAVAFDKTGTLTQGKPQVTDVVAWEVDQSTLLTLSASIEVGSSHPLAVALVHYVQQMGVSIPEAHDKTAQVGAGVSGVVQGKRVELVSPSKAAFPIPLQTERQVAQLEQQGKTVVIVRYESEIIGVIAWQDTLRQDAAQAVTALSKLGISAVMLTGDNPRSAQAMAEQIGIDYQASLLPADKVHYVEQLSKKHVVAMVGDANG